MRLRILAGALLSVFIIVANDNGLFGTDENLSQSQIQRDQQNVLENQSGQTGSDLGTPQTRAYPPYPDQTSPKLL